MRSPDLTHLPGQGRASMYTKHTNENKASPRAFMVECGNRELQREPKARMQHPRACMHVFGGYLAGGFPMDVLDAIRLKRSVRQFALTPLPDEAISTILNAGRRAQSSKNTQPWNSSP